MVTKFSILVDVHNIIMHVKFQNENFMGSEFTGVGDRNLTIYTDFTYGP